MAALCESCGGVGAEPCDCPHNGGCSAGDTHIPGVVICFACNGTGHQPHTGRTGWGHERKAAR